ncbi:hypothetical protein KGM_207105 [Danaus plexippus plexippus]|uniref:Uncharacterized protein n=1 Tax=Danaus plexippus plexippus TaxID=278856 RepID=A0A212FN24_DANPL|nr:hypothetical protein KGM_207105 [Danaus plexippus plexippus]
MCNRASGTAHPDRKKLLWTMDAGKWAVDTGQRSELSAISHHPPSPHSPHSPQDKVTIAKHQCCVIDRLHGCTAARRTF